MKICYIVGAGEFGDGQPRPLEVDMVIACDGGFDHCRSRGIRVDLVVGDFDSINSLPENEQIVRLKPEKDETDMGWAVMEGWRRGYREFVFYGGTEGRFSHTIANIALLTDIAEMGGHGLLIGRDCWMRVIHNEEIRFGAEEEGYLSVFCLGDRAEGVCEEGLKYGLDDALLTKGNPLGVSNEFLGKESRVLVKEGTLLLVWEKKSSFQTVHQCSAAGGASGRRGNKNA